MRGCGVGGGCGEGGEKLQVCVSEGARPESRSKVIKTKAAGLLIQKASSGLIF